MNAPCCKYDCVTVEKTGGTLDYTQSITHLLVFLAPDIIFIGQLKKDIGFCFRVIQYLSPADQ